MIRLSGLLATLMACAPPTPDSRIACDVDSSDHPAAAALRSVLDDAVARGLPGLAVAVRTPEGVWQGAAGYADLEARVPMNACHVHPMASVGKTWHASLALRLVEQGRLELDARIAELLPADAIRRLPNADRITVRQLMDHSSGLPDFNEHLGYLGAEFDDTLTPDPPERTLDWLRGAAARFEPGEGYAYSDTAYMLLAMIIDEVTGDRVDAMDEAIHRPLGMARTWLPRGDDPDPEGRVNSYWEIGGGRLENVSALQAKYDVQVHGAGNVRSTLADALAFVDGVARGDVLSEASRDAMRTWNPHSEDDDGYAYGLGIARSVQDGVLWIGHTGGDVGAGSVIRARPDAPYSVVAMTNVGMFLGGPLQDVWNEDLFAGIIRAAEAGAGR